MRRFQRPGTDPRYEAMRLQLRSSLLTAILAVAACGPETDDQASIKADMPNPINDPFAGLTATAPKAEKHPLKIEQHGVQRIDNYAWLRDENWQEVLRDPGALDAGIRTHLE